MPDEPVMVIIKSSTSLFVKITKKKGRYAVGKYCMEIVETNEQTCLVEASAYGPEPHEGNTTFSGLTPYTDYTVQGWIINGDHIPGATKVTVVKTLADSKPSNTSSLAVVKE